MSTNTILIHIKWVKSSLTVKELDFIKNCPKYYEIEIDNASRDTITINQKEYNDLLKRINDLENTKSSYTLLWEGEANKIGNKDNNGKDYKFIDPNMDIDNYDFILVECKEVNSNCPSKQSVLLSKGFISKNVKYDNEFYRPI